MSIQREKRGGEAIAGGCSSSSNAGVRFVKSRNGHGGDGDGAQLQKNEEEEEEERRRRQRS
jgi:hypothetical protein